MGTYRKIKKFIENTGILLDILKNRYSERKAIRHKAPLYRDIPWTQDQQKAFEEYWTREYGKKIPDMWHKLFQRCNGVFQVSYFPDYLFSTELEWRVNPEKYAYVLGDKNLLPSLFGSVSDLHIPYSLLSCCNGVYLDCNRKIVPKSHAEEILSSAGKIVIKPTVESCSGHNVCVLEMKDGIDLRTKRVASEILERYGNNFVAQEIIQPCAELQSLSPYCLSTFRVMTYLTDTGVFSCPISLRLGTGTAEVDNIHAGGLAIYVDNDGFLSKTAYRLGYGDAVETYEKHPDSNIMFKGFHIPGVPNIIEMAKRLHQRVPQLGLLSWDFTIDGNGVVTLIELNTNDQSTWIPQMISKRSLFEENTQYFLDLIRKSKKGLSR